MRKLAASFALAGIIALTGCGTACGPIRTVPSQRLALGTTSPDSFTIRVVPKDGPPIETPVPPNGRVMFTVPVTSRASTILFVGIPIYRYPPPDKLQVIHVVHGGKTIRKLSAQMIEQLPIDSAGFHFLKLNP